jgi:hypothetical protein
MAEENLTLKESVEKAANEQEVEATSEVREEIKEEIKEDKADVVDIDPEIDEAVAFYKALKDPAQQSGIIAELARRAGFIKENEQPTKAEEKRYGQLLEEILGQEYPDLKDKFAKVLSAFEKENDQKLAYLKHEINKERQIQQANEFDREFASFISDNKVTEQQAAKMMKEIEQLPPSVGKNGKRIPLTQYLDKIYKIVNVESRNEVQTTKRIEKIETNSRNRATNLKSDISEDRLKQGSRLPSVREAISAAAQGIKFDND